MHLLKNSARILVALIGLDITSETLHFMYPEPIDWLQVQRPKLPLKTFLYIQTKQHKPDAEIDFQYLGIYPV